MIGDRWTISAHTTVATGPSATPTSGTASTNSSRKLPPLFGEGLHVAAEFGAKKPDPEVYRRLVARHKIEPTSAMMIDDKPENVEGAKAAGLAGHRFTGIDGLRQELRARGLL